MDLNNLPDVTFAQKDVQTILSSMINGYEESYFEQTGEKITLAAGNKIRIFLYSQALKEFQLRQLIDFSAKQNLLRYSSGDYIEHLGAFYDLPRLSSSKAIVTMRFFLSQAQSTDQIIPSGTRVSTANNIYFEVSKDIEVPAGSTQIDIAFECIQSGTIGNNLTPGQINILVDPLPWIQSVSNIDVSQGGADIETDDNFRERIHEAPEGFSTAGPEGAYLFFAKKYSSLLQDIAVDSLNPGEVDITVLLQNGEIPDDSFLNGLNNFLSDRTIRPLTDKLVLTAPTIIKYSIDITYYTLKDDSSSITSIQSKINDAVQKYILWQKSKIGRNINPSILNAYLINAGAYKVDVTNPSYTEISKTQIAIIEAINVSYGGAIDE